MTIIRQSGNFKKFDEILEGEVFEWDFAIYLQTDDGVVDLTNGCGYISLNDFIEEYPNIEDEELKVFEAELIIK